MPRTKPQSTVETVTSTKATAKKPAAKAATKKVVVSAASREINFAIVGCGAIGPWHAGAIARVEGARLAAVVDLQRERAEKAAAAYQGHLKEWGIAKTDKSAPKIYTDVKRMLARPEIDVVCVCVPSGDHAKIALLAARAGKHIITEKPLEITLEKMDAMIEAARENNVKLAAIFQRRFFTNAQRIKQGIESGKFGKLLQIDGAVKWYRSQEYYDSGDWRGTWELDGGGAVMNQGVHGVDLMQWFGGPVAWVQSWCGTVDRKNLDVETQAIAIIGFKSGAHGSFLGSTICYPGEAVTNQVWGAKGAAELSDTHLARWKFLKETKADREMMDSANDAGLVEQSDPRAALGGVGDMHYPQIKDMCDAIRENRDPICTGADARHAVEIILAIYESARRGGERIRLPLAGDFEAKGFPKKDV
ncbi:MAG TPA: Gfo/Idh/MocA family oxidoreductase [Abditibacteriaceae bacterium]